MRITDEKNAGLSSEDEVEMPDFNEGNFDGEKNNDENDYVHPASAAYWPKIHEKLTSNVKKPSKFDGISLTGEEELDLHESPRLDEPLPMDYNSQEEAAANPMEGLQEKPIHKLKDARTAKGFGGHESVKHSMADLLDGLQEKNYGLYAIPKRIRRKGREKKVGVIKKASMIEKKIANVEDPCEIINSGTSSDDESKDHCVVLTTPQAKKKTMADQFQEAFGATSVNEGSIILLPKQSRACSGGLVEKLQRVIQREKEHDLDFTKNLQSETLGDEAGYMDVKKASIIEKKIANVEDPCEIIDSGTSSDDESKDHCVVLTTPQAKKKTMADQFQEAFGATSVNEGSIILLPKQSRACSGGLVEKLQRVIQREKEHDLDFTKNLQSETLGDEAGYMDVKILSRLFEAKLTVCVCSINFYKKSSVFIEKPEEERVMHKTRTIIFNSRTCVNVELDAGTCVRVWSPWKEVQVLGGNIIILASYFTQTLT